MENSSPPAPTVDSEPSEEATTVTIEDVAPITEKPKLFSVEIGVPIPEKKLDGEYSSEIVWTNVFLISGLHVLAIAALYSFTQIHFATFIFYPLVLLANLLGVTAGAHRLWSHRSYKATLPLRILLMVCNTVAMQNSLHEWVRDHRGHHRFSETDADPHNAKRGAFFSHVGWLCLRKHPEVIRKGATLDLSDLEEDEVVMFQRKFYKLLVPLFWAVLPTTIPTILWDENPVHAFLVCVAFRYCFSLHATWLVNSAAHLVGSRPYDGQFWPRQNSLVTYLSLGEGYHNFHHVFPWHYSTSEWGGAQAFNLTTLSIDLFCWLGLASDRKTVSEDLISARIKRTGDKSLRVPPNPIMSNLIGVCVGFSAFWVPVLIRLFYDFFTHQGIFSQLDLSWIY